MPAISPNAKWLPAARLYYTLEAMNLALSSGVYGDLVAIIDQLIERVRAGRAAGAGRK